MLHPENTPDLFAFGGISGEERKKLFSLDMGAGDGSSGCHICIDIDPHAPTENTGKTQNTVIRADMLALPFPDGTFDFVISQCAFYVSGDPERALKEAMRVLKPGGKLLLSDVFFTDPTCTAPWNSCMNYRDITDQWREYYFRLLWEDGIPPCFAEILKKEKHAPRYYMLVFQKENLCYGPDGKNT